MPVSVKGTPSDALLPKRLRLRALLGTGETIIDLAVPVDPGRDHVRGPDEAPVTLVEYGVTQDMRRRTGQPKVISDIDSATLSGVSGTPTFFINGRRHYGAYDIDTLSTAVRAARARVLLSTPAR